MLQTVFLLFQLEQPIAVSDSYFLRIFSLFSRLFFTFPDDKLLLQFLGFALINSISRYLWFLGTQLHFKGSSCASQVCLHRSSSQAGWHFLCQYFILITSSPLWLLPSATQALWSRKATALSNFLGCLNAHPEEEEVEKMSQNLPPFIGQTRSTITTSKSKRWGP